MNDKNNEKKSNLLALLVAGIMFIAMVLAIAIPQHIKYIKRSRTSEGVQHAKKLCDANLDWYSSPQLGDGNFAANTDAIPKHNPRKRFRDCFPKAANWWDNGDDYYTFHVGTTISQGASIPKIWGYCRDDNKAFGCEIETAGGCDAEVTEISG